ncbi:MAG: hypothetical protein R3C60_04470 [Parvularculaceae bacterium]
MGNRGGSIHDPETRTLTKRRWASKRWIACVLSFKGRRRTVMGAGYTELFFLDDATALASGHRPCFECRRKEAGLFADAFMRARHLARPPRANEMDEALHKERIAIFKGAAERRRTDSLPPGTMVARKGDAFLVTQNGVKRWRATGYDRAQAPHGDYEVLTPPSIVAALAAGYGPRGLP